MKNDDRTSSNWFPEAPENDSVDLSPDIKLPIDGEELNDGEIAEITGDWLGTTQGKILQFIVCAAIIGGLIWGGIKLWHMGPIVFWGSFILLAVLLVMLVGRYLFGDNFDDGTPHMGGL
jgi:hypothetical protein